MQSKSRMFLTFVYFFQQIQAQTIIVIHPGSLYLRIGRAYDLNPHTILHVVARRRLPGGLLNQDTFLPLQVPKVFVVLLSRLAKK